jgi:hypothetical protein
LNIPEPEALIQQPIPSCSSPGPDLDERVQAKPGGLLLALEVCGLVGILCAIAALIWSPPFLTLGDIDEYHRYALAFWTQTPLFHQFPQEYPPLALIPFSFTLSPLPGIHDYWAFAWWMGVIFCLSYLWLARSISHRIALVYALYLLVGTMATLFMRYDLLPALATLGALLLAERKRYAWAYVLLAVGVLLKLYPAFLLPVVMAAHWHEGPLARSEPQAAPVQKKLALLWQRWQPLLQGPGIFVALLALGFGLPLATNTQAAASVFQYNLARPIQLESTPASLLWLGTFFGFPVQGVISFGSLNLAGPLEDPLKLLALAGLIGGSLLIYWRVWRGNLSLGQAFLATIGCILIFNKVLSPQYFIWVLPLAAYILGCDLLWLLICLLTTLIYPFLYHVYFHVAHAITSPVLLWAIAIRNALLVLAVGRAMQGKPAWPKRLPGAIKLKKSINAASNGV